MAIDFSCYASDSLEEATKMLDEIRKVHHGLFDMKFLISDVSVPSVVSKEIALDFGFYAKCMFVVALNEKEHSRLTPTVTFVLKQSFGPGKLLMLHTNETLM